MSVYGVGKPTQLAVWDAATGKPAGPGAVRARPTYPARVVARARGDWFATAGHYGPEVWKASDPGVASAYRDEHTGYVEDLAPSPDGRTLLSVRWDHTAHVRDAATGRPRTPDPVCSPDGARAVAASFGTVARIGRAKLLGPPEWPVEDYRLLAELASGQRIEQGARVA